jgi:hypothetical protein
MKKIIIILILKVVFFEIKAQQLPGLEENIPFMVTFSKEAEKSWGDDDFCQIAFMVIPKSQKSAVYLRVFDADVAGKHDENRGGFNSSTKFSIYGTGCYSANEQENKDPVGGYKKGNILFSKIFSSDTACDNKWYTFGPINPAEGELKPELGGYVFKIIIEGGNGDDGNLYRFFLSTEENKNNKVEGGNIFVYEYSFRLNADKSMTHLYPYVDINTIAIKQYNFDVDNDAYVKMISMSNPGVKVDVSGDGNWKESSFEVTDKDKNTSLDVQIVKTGNAHNNNVVFSFTNQYGKHMPFYAIPIGAIPKKNIVVKPKGKK